MRNRLIIWINDPYRKLILIALLCIAAGIHAVSYIKVLESRTKVGDFAVYYLSAREFLHNRDPYTADFAAEGSKLGVSSAPIAHATDPPTSIVMFSPLVRPSPELSFWIWTGINFAALIASVIILAGCGGGLTAPATLALAALSTWFPPVVDNFYWGQNKLLLLLALALMMWLAERGRDAAAGFTLALASLTRVFPLLLIGYFLLLKRRRLAIFSIIGIVAGAAITTAVFGFRNSLDFTMGARLLTDHYWLGASRNIAMDAFISRQFWRFGGHNPGLMIDLARRALIVAADSAILLVTVNVTVGRRTEDDPDWAIFCLWLVASIMLSPTAWLHYLVLLIIPIAMMLSKALRHEANVPASVAMAISFILLETTYQLGPLVASQPSLLLRGAVQELAFPSVVIAFAAVYLFATGRFSWSLHDIPEDGYRMTGSFERVGAKTSEPEVALTD